MGWPDKRKEMSKEEAIKKISETPTISDSDKLAGIRRVIRSKKSSAPQSIADEFYPKPPRGW